jgi:3-oxoadipate enol-lactonase
MKLAFSDSGGTGRPVLLVHGFPFDRRMWASAVAELRASCRVVCPDLRGHGASPVGEGSSRMEDMARDLAELLDSLGVESAAVGGLSMGGYVALAFARLFPKRLRALVLADTRAAADSPEAKKGRHDMVALVREKGARAVSEKLLPKLLSPSARGFAREFLRLTMDAQPVEGIVGALLGMAERPDSTEILPKIACPTLVVCGTDDVVTPIAESREMAAKIRGSKLVSIPGAGHVSNLEAPALFDAALAEFLAGV